MIRKMDAAIKAFTTLLLCFVLSCTLNNSYEIAGMMNGTLAQSARAVDMPAWAITLTPIYLKVFKDIFLLLTVLLLVFSCFKFPRRARIFFTKPFFLLNFFVVLLFLIALYSLTLVPTELVVMGIRGYWTIILIYAGAYFYDFNEHKIYRSIVIVFSLQFLLQLIQFAANSGYSVYFEHRSPGLFIIPSTAGAFALLVHYFSIKFESNILRITTIISLLLSNSTTGLLILIAYYVYTLRNKIKPKIVFYPIYFSSIVLIGYVMMGNLGEITGRGGGASSSALARLGVLYVALSSWNNLLFGLGLGSATSQAVLTGYSNAVIADNTYIGILYNAGVLPAVLMFGFVISSFRYFENKLLYFIFFGYSMTTVIFEINPVVQIILILLGANIGRKYAASRKAIKGTLRTSPLIT
jgi:hypothetical protein